LEQPQPLGLESEREVQSREVEVGNRGEEPLARGGPAKLERLLPAPLAEAEHEPVEGSVLRGAGIEAMCSAEVRQRAIERLLAEIVAALADMLLRARVTAHSGSRSCHAAAPRNRCSRSQSQAPCRVQ